MNKIQQEKILHPSNLYAIHLRFSSNTTYSCQLLGHLSLVLFDRRDPQDISNLMPCVPTTSSPPELASLYLCISDCFSPKGLLLIKKLNTRPPNHDVPKYRKKTTTQPVSYYLSFVFSE